MPTLGELRSRFTCQTKDNRKLSGEECLVADTRALMRPAQMVEQKLRNVMQASESHSHFNAVSRTPIRKG